MSISWVAKQFWDYVFKNTLEKQFKELKVKLILVLGLVLSLQFPQSCPISPIISALHFQLHLPTGYVASRALSLLLHSFLFIISLGNFSCKHFFFARIVEVCML